MPLAKNITGRPKIDRHLVSLPGSHKRRLLLRFTVTCAEDPLRQVLCESIRGYIHQLRGEVSVHSGGVDVKLGADWTSDFRFMGKGRSRIDQNVWTGFSRALVTRPRRQMLTIATQWTANGRNRIPGIVSKVIRSFRAWAH